MPVSLEILNLSGISYNPHKFTGGIPAEWSSMTNLKELNMSHCGLDGASAFPGIPSQKRVEKRIARAGPSLPETLRLLAPLASTLEQLDLSGNKLGGTVTPDIAAFTKLTFTKLTVLRLKRMRLEGASLGITRHTAQK